MLWIYIYSFIYLYSLLGLKLMRGNCQVSRVESFVDAAPLGINTCRLQCTYFRVNGGKYGHAEEIDIHAPCIPYVNVYPCRVYIPTNEGPLHGTISSSGTYPGG